MESMFHRLGVWLWFCCLERWLTLEGCMDVISAIVTVKALLYNPIIPSIRTYELSGVEESNFLFCGARKLNSKEDQHKKPCEL